MTRSSSAPVSTPADTSPTASPASARVTPRALALGLSLALLLCAITPYNDYYVGATYLSGNFFPIGAIGAVMFLALVVNPLLIAVKQRHRLFTSAEIITVWSLMVVVSGIPSSGLMRYLIPHIAAPRYYATPTNGWSGLIIAHLPSYLILNNHAAVQAFFEGLPRGTAIPWGAWAVPLFWWGLFVACLFLAYFCLAALVRRQWVEHERFAFPLVQLPLLLAETPEPGRYLNTRLRSPLFWVGVLTVTILHTVNGLHQLFPMAPEITVTWHSSDFFTAKPWNGLNDVELAVFPLVIGFAYLLPTDICASLWLFYLIFKMQTLVGNLYAWNMAGPGAGICMGPAWSAYQEAGGALMLTAWLLWSMRAHLHRVWRKALFHDPTVDDASEPLSYRFALFGLIAAYAGMFAWLTLAAHVGVLLTTGLLAGSLVIFLMLSWMVAQAGLLFIQQAFSPAQVVTMLDGTSAFSPASLTMAAMTEQIGWQDAREFMLPSLLNAGRAASEVRLDARALTRALALCVCLATVVAGAASLWLPYTHGGGTALKNPWMYINSPQIPFSWAAGQARDPQPPQWNGALNMAGGALLVLILFVCRNAFPWFSLHPAGFLIAATYPMYTLWFSLFLGWLFKTPILRYGGSRGYRQLLPFFLGLILGDCANALIWTVIGLLTGTGYNLLPG